MERKIRQFCKWNRVFRRISHVRARTLFEVLVSSFESIIFSTRDTPAKVTLNARARGERFEKIVTQLLSICKHLPVLFAGLPATYHREPAIKR